MNTFIRLWHLSREGVVSRVNITDLGGEIRLGMKVGEQVRCSRLTGDIWDMVQRFPQAVTIGTGATVLEWGDIEDERLLGSLIIEEPWLVDMEQEAWEYVLESLPDEDMDRFSENLEADGSADIWEGAEARFGEIVHRRIRLNGFPAAVFAGRVRSAVIAVDDEGERMPFVRPFFAYEYAREPGGPVVMAGTFEASTQAPNVYTWQGIGDYGPFRIFLWDDQAMDLAAADQIQGHDAWAAFLRFRTGLPGCSTLIRKQLAASNIMGEQVWVDASRIDLNLLEEILAGRDTRMQRMGRALRTPDSADGRRAYEAIGHLVEPYWEGDWDAVDKTLLALGADLEAEQ